MLLSLNEDQILAGSDASSIKSGKDLATTKKWVTHAHDDRAIWGECQGSGKLPYQAIIDTQNLAYKCNCPSRKFPCKHGLGLALLYVRNSNIFTNEAAPTWVSDWISKRESSQQKKAERIADEAETPEKLEKAAKAAAKTAEKRENNVALGLADLQLWLSDWIRTGILSAPEKNSSYWANQAARLVDAQAPALANVIKEIGEINYFQPNWEVSVIERFSYLHLLVEGYKRINELPTELQSDVRNLIGFNIDLVQLKQQNGILGTWLVVGKETEIDSSTNLHVERNWLYCVENQKFALILNFAFRGQFPADYIRLSAGQVFNGEIVYLPSSQPLRALIKTKADQQTLVFPEGKTMLDALTQHCDFYERNPWLTRIPILLDNIKLVNREDNWFCIDDCNNALPLSSNFNKIWLLLSLTGGYSFRLFAIRENNALLPLGIWNMNPLNTFDYYFF